MLGLLALEKGMQLAFAPGRPLRSQGEDGGLLVGADGVGLMARGAGAIGKTGDALAIVALQPLVAGLAADAVDAAQIGDRFVAGLDFPHEIHSFVVHTSLLPGQNRMSSFCSGLSEICYPCARVDLLPMSSGRTRS